MGHNVVINYFKSLSYLRQSDPLHEQTRAEYLKSVKQSFVRNIL